MFLSFSLDVVLQGQRSEVEAMITDMGVGQSAVEQLSIYCISLKKYVLLPANPHILTAVYLVQLCSFKPRTSVVLLPKPSILPQNTSCASSTIHLLGLAQTYCICP